MRGEGGSTTSSGRCSISDQPSHAADTAKDREVGATNHAAATRLYYCYSTCEKGEEALFLSLLLTSIALSFSPSLCEHSIHYQTGPHKLTVRYLTDIFNVIAHHLPVVVVRCALHPIIG